LAFLLPVPVFPGLAGAGGTEEAAAVAGPSLACGLGGGGFAGAAGGEALVAGEEAVEEAHQWPPPCTPVPEQGLQDCQLCRITPSLLVSMTLPWAPWQVLQGCGVGVGCCGVVLVDCGTAVSPVHGR